MVGDHEPRLLEELQGRVPQGVGEWQDQLRLASRESCEPAQLWSSWIQSVLNAMILSLNPSCPSCISSSPIHSLIRSADEETMVAV